MQELNDSDIAILLIKRVLNMSAEEQIELLRKLDGIDHKKKRGDDRKSYFMMVDYTINGHYFRDFIKDISISGVFIKTSNAFPVGQNLSLSFMSPDHQKPLKIIGEIVRSFPTGIGVKFKKISQTQEKTIQSIMEKIKET